MKINHAHIQHWGSRVPSREDVLVILKLSLDLLSEALPVAARSVGRLSVSEQMRFWFAFNEFSRDTDFACKLSEGDDGENMRHLIKGFAELAEEQVNASITQERA